MTKQNETRKNLRAAIYSRISTQEQIDRTEYDSMQSHMDRCKHYILAQEDWNLIKVYEDPDESGYKWERPMLQEMLHDVKNQRVDVVVCYKLDRISRSVKDFHRILEILEENDVALVSVTQGLDTSTAAGKLLRNILIDFAQFERDMTSER
jgi:DNA invertase Pin-like site-specific DNA recombinase